MVTRARPLFGSTSNPPRNVAPSADRRSTSDVSEYYNSDRIVDKYVSNARAGLNEVERRAVDGYFPSPAANVLDLGCGTGRTTGVLNRMGYDVIGVDLTRSLVDRARRLFPDVSFVVGDAVTLPFEEATFQYALFAFNGIDDVTPEENRYEVLREVRRVLNPGGVFVFSSHNLWSTYVLRSLDLEGLWRYVEFWVQNIRRRRLLSRYKWDNSVESGPRPIYYIRPRDQKRQLRNCGFEVRAVVRPDGPFERFFHHPYYVVRKPE